ncbi:unnamed protein product [Durusdinium trenchii]|uniref:EGF-like domain-containing protein n=1 Tax=Durusdinium trenchii TaxID=1381693 RepID=A0ABP0KY13_9DINO
MKPWWICELLWFGAFSASYAFSCSEGYFYNFTSSACDVCPAGKYQEMANSMSCDDCPPGTYLEDDGVNWKLHVHQRYCSLCPLGKASNSLAATACIDCEIGRFANFPGNTECWSCGWSMIAGVANMSGSSTCSPCEFGYIPDTNYTACTACPEGKYNNNQWGYCDDCDWGQVSQAGSSSCERCSAGTYASNNTCIDCPEGRYSWSESIECYDCWEGTAAAGTGNSDCRECPAGRYASSAAAACSPCAAGTTSVAQSNYCYECPYGEISQEGSPICTNCPPGWYANDNATECLECPGGTYKGAQDSYCNDCSSGYFSFNGSATCDICPAGKYSDYAASSCIDCSAGTYSSYDGSYYCDTCYYEAVLDNGTTCGPCPAGKVMQGNPIICVACDPGTFSTYGYDTNCSQCPQGRYSAEVGRGTPCEACLGLTTQAAGSTSINDCISPVPNQTFQCPRGKECSVADFQGVDVLSTNQLMAKHDTCMSSGSEDFWKHWGSIGYGSYYYSGYGYGGYIMRRLQTIEPGSQVSGFSYDPMSSQGSNNFSWTGPISSEVGTYRLCWCGGATGCWSIHHYEVDAGTISVLGPYPDQSVVCVIGRLCEDMGPIQGLGLQSSDLVNVRSACKAEFAGAMSVPLQVTSRPNSLIADADDLYLSAFGVAWFPPDTYALCWCSALGASCSSDYLEALLGTVYVSGPKNGNSGICGKGQFCWATLMSGGTQLAAGDRLTFLPSCGTGEFLTGLPAPYLTTQNGFDFFFPVDDLLFVEPGMNRMCWCRQDLSQNIDCEKGSDFNVEAGLFLAVGPYTGQSQICTRGQDCVVTGLRGLGLSLTDKITPLSDCYPTWLPTQTFFSWPPPQFPLQSDPATGGYKIDAGTISLEGHAEAVQMCWCVLSDISQCEDPWFFGAVAATVYMACANGWYELAPGYDSRCKRCLQSYYCEGGWPSGIAKCAAGTTSPVGSVTAAACECREGYEWNPELSVCVACAEGTYKDSVGNTQCLGRCPPGTTSASGAIHVRECYCTGDTIDTDPLPDSFACSDLVELMSSFSDSSFSSTEALVYIFQGTMRVADASSVTILNEIFLAIGNSLLALPWPMNRLSVNMVPFYFNETAYVNYSISSSEESLILEIYSKFDSDVFGAWALYSMKGTALDSAESFPPTQIAAVTVQCPEGLGFPDGALIEGLQQCACPHGMQPATTGARGLDVGCVRCPVGKYKSSVADVECTQCPTGNGGEVQLTTLQEGSISYASCTCGPGLLSLPGESSCSNCGFNFFCLGGAQRQACHPSKATVVANAKSEDECLCAAGFYPANTLCLTCDPGRYKGDASNSECTSCPAGTFSGQGEAACHDCDAGRYSTGGMSSCELCPEGRFSQTVAATSLESCLPCETGKWSNDTGVASVDGCMDCVLGSTTVSDGAEDLSYCVRPDPEQTRNCTSGRVCVAENVTGSRLQDGHRLLLTLTNDCTKTKSLVSGIAENGVSGFATEAGSRYVWGSTPSDFTPEGAWRTVCWCSNIGDLLCDSAGAFLLSAGRLLIIGPQQADFYCVRGQDCDNLQPFSGFGLLESDHLVIQRDACGSSATTDISPDNQLGTGFFQPLSRNGLWVTLILTFGTSDGTSDYHVEIDASQRGYLLCWCSGDGASTCNPEDHVVDAGRLKVLGPNTNQERGCAVGQVCQVDGVLGASMQPKDLLRILSDCGRGAAIPGFPGQGVLHSSDGSDFTFLDGGDQILLSVPGIFRICFCRPGLGEVCDSSSGFKARVGLMTASGPFVRSTTCELGSSCTISLTGIGLSIGDQLWLAQGACGSSEGLGPKGFEALTVPIPVVEGSVGFEVNLGTLPFSALPGVYQLCWCPVSADCSRVELFRAPAGSLQADCPPGSFASGPVTGRICEVCSRGYYCGGGKPSSATRIPCALGETTLFKGAVSSAACLCDKGYSFDTVKSSCEACSIGFYKTDPGNQEPCSQCETNYTTYATGSVSNSSCIPEFSQTSSGSSNQDHAEVPAVSFQLSLFGLPTDEDPAVIRQQLIELFLATLSAATRMDPSAISIDFLTDTENAANSSNASDETANAPGRRLQIDLSRVVFTIKTRTEEEAATTVSDLDVSAVTNEITSSVQENPTLGDGINVMVTSPPQKTSTTVTCPIRRSIPPGVPIQSAAECQCSPGFGIDQVTGACDPCILGEYKDNIADAVCDRCPSLRSTQQRGSTSLQDCVCEAGLFEAEGGICSGCPEGHYCDGSGFKTLCPPHSTTPNENQRGMASDCECTAGYFYISNGSDQTVCKACDRGRYKPNLGKGPGQCPLTCPANAITEPAASSLSDCFCLPDFYADVEESTGQLARCISCTWEGLLCRGGFENRSAAAPSAPRVHALPIARTGFYQTGVTTAVACDVQLEDGSSACLGGEPCVMARVLVDPPSLCNGREGMRDNGCAEGSSGTLCGQCPPGYSRDSYPDLCQTCPADPVSVLAMGIASDIIQKAALNFVVAVMAATTAVKGGTKLHTSIIRLGTQWIAACSVLMEFNMETLPGFDWSEKDAEMQKLAACAESNSTECDTKSEGLKMPWPPEATAAMNSVLSFTSLLVPRIATVEFATSCYAESLGPELKLAGPAMYYLLNPLGAMAGVFIICAFAVYCLIPCANKGGMLFNPRAQRMKAKKKAVEKLEPVLSPLLDDLGLTWVDLEAANLWSNSSLESIENASEDPDSFISGDIAFSRKLAVKMCLHKSRRDPHVASLCRQVHLTWEEFKAEPDILIWHLSDERVQEAALGETSPSLVELMVKRALAWKLRDNYEAKCTEAGVRPFEVAAAVADIYDTAAELYGAQDEEEEKAQFEALCRSKMTQIRRKQVGFISEGSAPSQKGQDQPKKTVDIETLDFGLFSSFPWPLQLFYECVPVFWVVLLAMWPGLLSNFLKMIWCLPIVEDIVENNQVVTTSRQRLRPDPEVICWEGDHYLVYMISFIGLGVWCCGVPILLYLRLLCLRDRQSPDNFRKYGYFIQGYEPQYWWWDIIVKRLDVGLMKLTTYTSMAADEKAKLLLFPILSGFQLGIFSWYKPFIHSQGGILDILEMCLLIARFTLFSAISIILIFNPSQAVAWVLAGALVLLLGCTLAFFLLHTISQFLRGAAAELEETSNTKQAGQKKKGLAQMAVGIKKFFIELALPFFMESDDEKLYLEWSLHSWKASIVSAAERKGQTEQATRSRIVSCFKSFRAFVLHHGPSVERQNLAKAFSDFGEAWMEDFDQPGLPVDMVHVLCVLTATSSFVPAKTPLSETAHKWQQQAENLLRHGHEQEKHYVSADSLVSSRTRLLNLNHAHAVTLVQNVQDFLLSEKRRATESRRIAKEAEERKQLEAAKSAKSGGAMSPVHSLLHHHAQAQEVLEKAKTFEKTPMVDSASQTTQSAMAKKTNKMDEGEVSPRWEPLKAPEPADPPLEEIQIHQVREKTPEAVTPVTPVTPKVVAVSCDPEPAEPVQSPLPPPPPVQVQPAPILPKGPRTIPKAKRPSPSTVAAAPSAEAPRLPPSAPPAPTSPVSPAPPTTPAGASLVARSVRSAPRPPPPKAAPVGRAPAVAKAPSRSDRVPLNQAALARETTSDTEPEETEEEDSDDEQ